MGPRAPLHREETHPCRLSPCAPIRAAALLAFTLFRLSWPSAEEAEPQERKFFFNAYVTQAWGETDGGQVLGLDEGGTFDYRNAALLGRWQLTSKDRFVVQLSHESIGESPLGEIRDDVELDWAFYEHRFPADFEVRVGRVPIPFGIYNEIRDVGPLLEFYRPPVSIYFEGAFSAEAVDGAVPRKRFFRQPVVARRRRLRRHLGSARIPGADDLRRRQPTTAWAPALAAHPGRGGAGRPRLPALRPEGRRRLLPQPADSDRFETWLVSLDADFERFVVRGEWQRIDTSFIFAPKVELPSYYVLAGLRLTDQLEIYGEFETSSTRFEDAAGVVSKFGPQYEDRARLFPLPPESQNAGPGRRPPLRNHLGRRRAAARPNLGGDRLRDRQLHLELLSRAGREIAVQTPRSDRQRAGVRDLGKSFRRPKGP